MGAVPDDFDRLAEITRDEWDHNQHYHRFLLRHLPRPCEGALDIGCGTGAFARLLARYARRVVALDLSPRMIDIARYRSRACANIEFVLADAEQWEWGAERFDCVATLTTLHHLPLEKTLSRIKQALTPGGVLLVLDLFRGTGAWDALASMAALPVAAVLRLVRTGRLRPPRAVRNAWAEHGRGESYPTLAEVRRAVSATLPRARVRRHLLWRYSIVWRNSAHTCAQCGGR